MSLRTPAETATDVATLEEIQRRVLWLATRMIHHANYVRPNRDGTKVGGHQASSASMVTLMTALYFHFLQGGDRVSVKPHASPVFHAIHYLLGRLPRRYLTELRAYNGLQAYPSRTKDPDPVDFSTGSVGLGAVAPAFAALAHDYTGSHFGDRPRQRFVALVGDAELDEGNVWEAILEPALEGLGNLLWIVDLNRQSLDRVVPGIRSAQLQRIFAESGWQVLEAKYGRRLREMFNRPGGDALRARIDEMSNEEYQALIRLPGGELRPRLVAGHAELSDLLANVGDDDLGTLLRNLGGHDMAELLDVLARVDEKPEKPTVIFAYTIKGWGLPIAGHPRNHSMLLTPEQIEALREELDVPADEWAAFPPDSAAGRLCTAAAQRLFPTDQPPAPTVDRDTIPAELPLPDTGAVSTQQTFGRLLLALSRETSIARRVVTFSPDVSISTNLAGWINKVGLYSRRPAPDYETESGASWPRTPQGQHVELGISEMNLFTALGAFGLNDALNGEPLIPIGTVYDPFVCRGLDAFIYGVYGGSRFIVAGTPSGITLSPEGGAHQSTITSSIGAELPELNFFEPCYAEELSWVFLEALDACVQREMGRSTYLRLSTRPIDQTPFVAAKRRLGADRLREQVLAGGYRLRDWRAGEPAGSRQYLIHLAATGAMIPEALTAADLLAEEGIPTNVLNLTSPRRLYEAWREMPWGRVSNLGSRDGQPFGWLIPPPERHAPLITINDGASHALAWLGSVFGTVVVPLGVDRFGQSGARDDLYRHYGIDAASIADAALLALNRTGQP